MADYAIKRIDDMEAAFAGAYKRARAELGVESFGLAVIDLPPDEARYPEHDHTGDGQEEVYLALRGSGEIEIDGQRHTLDPDTMVRVSPALRRKIRPGPDGLRLLALGGCPGRAYEPSELSRLGAADRLAGVDDRR
jgi:mannose-6-phosphate isomerase-like protein (cupin superfamily)